MMWKNSLAALLLLLQDGKVCAAQPSLNSPTATIDSGVVIGVQTTLPGSSNPVNKYYNIPYAAQPRRFDIPYRPQPWTSPYNATTVGPACIQQFTFPPAQQTFVKAAFNTPAPEESEDCLNVNVFAPATPTQAGSLRPILFWIYGGSLEFGWNGNPAYDGSSFAANQDVILIAANYRTNVFGFPTAPQIPPTQRNLGYWDQRLALDWVQRNARSFGGDPGRVTLIGESAGSRSVDSLVSIFPSPLNPPFHAAIMQSGQAGYYERPRLLNSTETWKALIEILNCPAEQDDLECARAAPAATIKNITETLSLSFRPALDDFTTLSDSQTARRTGAIAKVPLLIGTNLNEGSIFTLLPTNITTLIPSQADLVSSILSQYPVPSPEFPNEGARIAAIWTDLFYHCPAASVADNSIAAGIPTYRYLYNATFPNVQIVPNINTGVYHSSEIALVFGTYDLYSRFGGPTPTETQRTFSQLVQKAWADFAKDPTKGPTSSLGWSQVPNVLVLGGQNVGQIQGAANGTYTRLTSTQELDRRCAVYQSLLTPRLG